MLSSVDATNMRGLNIVHENSSLPTPRYFRNIQWNGHYQTQPYSFPRPQYLVCLWAKNHFTLCKSGIARQTRIAAPEGLRRFITSFLLHVSYILGFSWMHLSCHIVTVLPSPRLFLAWAVPDHDLLVPPSFSAVQVQTPDAVWSPERPGIQPSFPSGCLQIGRT
ncbi:hypothetical protein HYPSUDRAFT_1025359 [Hypholoma sublateritium FD-334 SS-4]|uniref:Uncharacterized protein n=1 Tax=Hypholoma sublateritium (strain FD-334 SS-4) TaxID=945553 RepID=A0A0D2NL06_HYPSF|nr:hypothetical protein HYPSUDRAFT_1025359 [Hypholoma sublateritium FD-334 SS-4]